MSKLELTLAYIGLIILTCVSVYPLVKDYFSIQPYWRVTQLYVEELPSETHIGYLFEKNGACSLQDFAVFGVAGNIPEQVAYQDLNKAIDQIMKDTGVLYDRTEGTQFLNISTEATKKKYDKIEIRTRHICTDPDGEKVTRNKVFTVIRLGT